MEDERLARYLTGESDPEERRLLDAWLAGHPARQAELARLAGVLGALRVDTEPWDAEAAWERHKAWSSHEAPTRLRVWTVGRIAAGLAALLLLTFLIVPPRGITLRAPSMQALADTLPDGSEVVLSPGSLVEISGGFGVRERIVNLTGEGWFRVAPGRDHQFTVRTPQLTVVDLGTAFAVRAPANDGSARVSVSEGNVAVRWSADETDRAVVVQAAQRVVARPGTPLQVEPDSNLTHRWNWHAERLEITTMPLGDLAVRLEEWYGVTVRLAEGALGSRRLTASFVNPELEAILDVLRSGLAVTADWIGDTVTIRMAP